MTKRMYVMLGLLVMGPALLLLVISIVRGTNPAPQGQEVTATASPSMTSSPAPTVETEHTHQEGLIDASRTAALEDAVYRFDEAYRSVPSAERTAILESLTTPEGLRSLGDLSAETSLAAQNAAGIKIEAIRIPGSIQPEPFDANNVSVYSTITVKRTRDGVELKPSTAKRLASWTWDEHDKQWKLAAITP